MNDCFGEIVDETLLCFVFFRDNVYGTACAWARYCFPEGEGLSVCMAKNLCVVEVEEGFCDFFSCDVEVIC